jgi:antitoxin component of RelBE/YafQ-DinJ toxin-antitoxin module
MRQQESEPLEEFSQRIYFMALDGFDKGNPEVVDQIATEAFLRGCRDKEAARSVLEKDPSSITQAVKMVKTYIANQRAIFGVRTSHSYAHRQVSFSDRDSTPERNPKKVQDGDTDGVSTKGRTIRNPSHLRDYVS